MKTRTLIIVAIAFVLIVLLSNRISLYFGLQDTAGLEEGMTFTQYTELFPEDKRIDFCNYSICVNDKCFPVLIRCEDDKIVKIQVIDLSKASDKPERFEELTPGMTLSQVVQKVGAPDGYSKVDDMTLVYNSRNEWIYQIQFTSEDNVLYVKSVTSESIEQAQ